MKRILISILMVLMLVTILSLPVAAAEEETSTKAEVTVGEFVNITLYGSINFGTLNPGDTDKEATTSPAITITVEPETNVNVDIGIMGDNTDGIDLDNWKYSITHEGTKVPIPTDYSTTPVYSDVGDGSYPFYHWITVPVTTASGTYHADVYYKAVKTGGSF
jgi:hypothetical protein